LNYGPFLTFEKHRAFGRSRFFLVADSDNGCDLYARTRGRGTLQVSRAAGGSRNWALDLIARRVGENSSGAPAKAAGRAQAVRVLIKGARAATRGGRQFRNTRKAPPRGRVVQVFHKGEKAFQVQNEPSDSNDAQILQVAAGDLPRRTAGFRILLADDSEADRFLTVAFLKDLRCVIDTAENGRIAVELFRTRCYDLVLMDFEMPVMDGQEAVREIRRIETETGTPPGPVLGLTAHTIAKVAMKAYKAGFTELLSKPLRREILLKTVATYGSPGPDTGTASSRIHADQDMAAIVGAYLEKRRGDMRVCRSALENADFDVIRRLAHKMKGTGSGYGFPRLTELGAMIESAALRSDASAVREHLGDLAAWMERVGL